VNTLGRWRALGRDERRFVVFINLLGVVGLLLTSVLLLLLLQAVRLT
jgi:hypothetical protein